MNFIQWIKPSFQGTNSTSSSRRLTAFWFVLMSSLNAVGIQVLVYLVILKNSDKDIDNNKIGTLEILISLEYILCGMILLLMSIVTAQQVIALKNSIASTSVTKETVTENTTEKTTTEKINPQITETNQTV